MLYGKLSGSHRGRSMVLYCLTNGDIDLINLSKASTISSVMSSLVGIRTVFAWCVNIVRSFVSRSEALA
jgi:hypothetical protein